jgi:1-acyl-sn-glycerol-3-phosphate acyltransferase
MRIKGERKYKTILRIFNGFFKLIKKYHVTFPERLPNENGLILVMNHRDYWDTPLIFSIMGKRPVHVLSKIDLKKEIVGKILYFMGAVFVDRENKESRANAKNELISIVQEGSNILIAPESTRNKTDSILLPFAGRGAVSIAQKTNRPIITFAISKYGTKGKQRLIRICEPFLVTADEDLNMANSRLYEYLYNALLENESYIKSEKLYEHRH